MIKKTVPFLLAILFLIVGSSFAQGLKIGVATRVITPDPLLPVSGGVGPSHPVTEKKGDLFARAIVMKKGDTRLAIVNVDNLGWPAALGNQSRELIKNIPPENILIGATHTHSAPDANGFPDDSSGHSSVHLGYLDWVVHQIADAVNEAESTMRPAWIKTAVGEAKGKIAYNYYAPQLYDHRVGVIQAIAASGKEKGTPLVTLVNYAIHPEVLGPQKGILSPDLVGPLYDEIEAQGGGTAIFMNSAQGGMVTADNRLPNGEEARDWEECKRIGTLLADQAIKVIEDAPIQEDPEILITSREVKLPVDNPVMQFIALHSPVYQMYPEQFDHINKTVKAQLNLINVGPAQIVTIPGEALPNIGFYLKRKMNTRQPFLFGLTNDAFGYILTSVDYDSFERYRYVSRTSLGEHVGDVLIEEVLKLVNDSPSAERNYTRR